MKVVFVELDRCIGCRSCERVCSFQETGGFKREHANIWVRVDLEKRTIFATTCLQCETALCMEVCPTRAISRDPATGAVVVDDSACVGCRMCMVACPFGCLHFESSRGVAAKCNLCGGNPRCVLYCMAGALHYGDINELGAIKRVGIDARLLQSPGSAPE